MEAKKSPNEMKQNRLERLAGVIKKEALKGENANVHRMYKFHQAWLNCTEQAKTYLGEEYIGKINNEVRDYIRIFQEHNYDRLPTF